MKEILPKEKTLIVILQLLCLTVITLSLVMSFALYKLSPARVCAAVLIGAY